MRFNFGVRVKLYFNVFYCIYSITFGCAATLHIIMLFGIMLMVTERTQCNNVNGD